MPNLQNGITGDYNLNEFRKNLLNNFANFHSIQRRFMWKQMDSTVDGFVDRVVTGARVMKSMIGDFMPPKPATSNAMDYLPTETTRIRYIIRNPHTKETKVIRVRPSKKVVKLMAMTPKPFMVDKPKAMQMNEPDHMPEKQTSGYMSTMEYMTEKPKIIHMNERDHMTEKIKPVQMKYPDHMSEKLKPSYMLDPAKLRQLEKEQELIAEGRIPMIKAVKPSYMAFRAEKYGDAKDAEVNFNNDDDILSGKIKEFNGSWKPVYKLGDAPAGFSTARPYMMSALHTSVVGELLPEPQKQIYEPLTSNEFPEDESKKSHTYEVTEYTAEESVVQPYAHDYYKQQNPASPRASSLKQSIVTTDNPNVIEQIEDDTTTKPYYSEYRSQRGFLPSRGSYRTNAETTTSTTTPTTTTTTEEEPNYPAAFLKKMRNRPDGNYNSKILQHNKSPEEPLENSWIPSNTSYSSQKNKQIPYHQHLKSANNVQRIKSQKWPPDVENVYLKPEPSLTYDVSVSTTTEVHTHQEFTTLSPSITSNSRKNVRLKTPHYSTFTEPKHRSVRQRGSIKYGDKLEIEER